MERMRPTRRAILVAAMLVGGAFVVGVALVVVAIIDSYDGMLVSVRCTDPNSPLCTGMYCGYGIPGIVLALAGCGGLALLAAGSVFLLRPGRRHASA
jgi:hypothetical protein